MTKELFISASPHETKVALWEDGELVEVTFERDTNVGFVGGIYKGRVNRVLPGMQSAFVDIGLERDAFLYVSDFYEDAEEYEKIVNEAEARVSRFTDGMATPSPEAPAAPAQAAPGEAPNQTVQGEAVKQAMAPPASAPISEPAEPTPVQAPSAGVAAAAETPVASPHATVAQTSPERPRGENPQFRRHEHRGRRRRGRGQGFGERKFGPRPEFRNRPAEQSEAPTYRTPPAFEILPGESLAKYSRPATETTAQASSAPPALKPLAASTAETTIEAPPEKTPTAPAEPPAGTVSLPMASAPSSPTNETAQVKKRAPFTPMETPVASTPESKPQPLWQRVVSSVFGEDSHSGGDEKAEGAAPPPAIPEASTVSAAPSLEPAEANQDSDTGPVSPQATSAEAASAPQAPGPEKPREYTLREQYQRPRFAPRRSRRGGRGRGQRPRPEGQFGPRHEVHRSGNIQPVQIAQVLKEGQEILVQVAKEPLGRKGARITSHIALPGRYLVYMPTVDHIGVSRKIDSEEERLRLRNIIVENKGSLTGGFIVRTAGVGKPEEELKADLKFLSTLWGEIRAKAERAKAPALLHRDLDLAQRMLRDILSPEFKTIWLDSETEYERVLEFVSRCQPSLVGHVKLYTRDTPMFEEFGVQAEIDKALKSKVWLKSGGYIVINQTEALVAIDVNTGKYVGRTNRLEDTIVKTNIDAVKEIVRQIRLRDLGGILVIDFIDMDERRNRHKVVQALEEALRADRAPTKILSFNDFGLVAITRKRVKHSLERTLCEPCSYCTGSGWIKSVTTVCYEILAEGRKMAKQLEGDVVTLRVNPEVAHALKSREGIMLSEFESIIGKDVIVKSDPAVHQERFEIY